MMEIDRADTSEAKRKPARLVELSSLNTLIGKEEYRQAFEQYLISWNERRANAGVKALDKDELGTKIAFALWQDGKELKTKKGESELHKQALTVLEERKERRVDLYTREVRENLYLDMVRADLEGVNLEKAHLGEADLRGADLRGANLKWVDLGGGRSSRN